MIIFLFVIAREGTPDRGNPAVSAESDGIASSLQDATRPYAPRNDSARQACYLICNFIRTIRLLHLPRTDRCLHSFAVGRTFIIYIDAVFCYYVLGCENDFFK